MMENIEQKILKNQTFRDLFDSNLHSDLLVYYTDVQNIPQSIYISTTFPHFWNFSLFQVYHVDSNLKIFFRSFYSILESVEALESRHPRVKWR